MTRVAVGSTRNVSATIRPMGLADFVGVRATLQESMAAAYASFMPTEEQERYVARWCTADRFIRELAHPAFHHTVAVIDSEVVGFASVEARDNERYAELWRLYVRPRSSRRGIGRALWRDAVRWVRDRRLREIHIETFADSASAQGFYRSVGCRVALDRTDTLGNGDLPVHLRFFVADV